MISNQNTLVTVFGGSGFLGRSVVRALARRDYRIRVGVRRPELAGHLQPLGKVGQIHAVQANLRYPASVEAAMRDAHVAVNLVGILAPSGEQTFDAVSGTGAGTVAKAAAAAGVAGATEAAEAASVVQPTTTIAAATRPVAPIITSFLCVRGMSVTSFIAESSAYEDAAASSDAACSSNEI